MEEKLSKPDVRTSSRQPGILCIPAPVVELSLSEGLWAHLNRAMGTAFDYAEEESLRGKQLTQAASLIHEFVDGHYKEREGLIRRTVAYDVAPQPGAQVAEIEVAEFVKRLEELKAFLLDSADRNKIVIVSL